MTPDAPMQARHQRGARPFALLIDNFDSFVYNLEHYVRELGGDTKVVRNDVIDVGAIVSLGPTHLIISPGPCTPAEAGVSNRAIAELGGRIPILGVCLGHQCIGEVYGGRIVRADRPMHGKTSEIVHDGRGVLRGVPSPFNATRYHSLIVERASLPEALEVSAWTADGTIMGLRHRRLAVEGVQFHPEALLTEHGHDIVRNFLGTG